jgi:uncharacterized protein (TIGR00661 family)
MRPKILYAVQGTGNGHVARAREIIPILMQWADVEVFLSGDQSQVTLPGTTVKTSKGLTFIYNKRGGLSMTKTLLKNNLFRVVWEVFRFPVHRYDLIINDFEFITAWSGWLKNKPVVGLGHQFALRRGEVPWPAHTDALGALVLRWYAPVSQSVGFHFQAFGPNIHTPVIRSEVRSWEVEDRGFFLAYLPAVGLRETLSILEQTQESWKVFSKEVPAIAKLGSIMVYPIDGKTFSKALATCSGVLTSAGFETPAEALFLGKRLAVVPIQGQFEQWCNAEALKTYAVPVFERWEPSILPGIKQWIQSTPRERIPFPNQTEAILKELVTRECHGIQALLPHWNAL